MQRIFGHHLFAIFVLILLLITNASSDSQQKYTIYSEANCEGRSETFVSSIRHLGHYNTSKLGYFGEIKSRRIYSGV